MKSYLVEDFPVLHAKLTFDIPSDARSEPRIGVATDLAIRGSGDAVAEARLINISSRGFMAEASISIPPGTLIFLHLPGHGLAKALVRWAQNGRIGGEFSEAIDPLAVIDAAGYRLGG